MLHILDQLIQDGVDRGLLQKYTSDEMLDSSSISIQEEQFINFGSCSYMGLEFHPALKAGVQTALEKYGTQFSTSRTYLSLSLYEALEAELNKMFQKPVLVSASTTLGHLATLPVIIEDGDAIILDLQVHSSVQMTAQNLKARKIPIHVIPHNDMEALESKIKTLSNKHKRIWYLADGVYSMYGDFAPLKELEALLNKYKQLYLYVDDAHGMGWTGENGVGYVRSTIEHHDKLILATSLNKSFASSGGAIVFPNEEWHRKVKNCGATMIFAGPIQPPMLGAALASARLHQTPEFAAQQEELKQKIDYTNRRLQELDLPQYKVTDSPLFFIPVGLPKVIMCIVKRMKIKGYYINSAGFPAVPMKKGGLRFMINNNLSIEEIEGMLVTMRDEYVRGLYEKQSSPATVAKEFKLPPFLTDYEVDLSEILTASHLQEEVLESIQEIGAEKWDELFKTSGTNTYHNLRDMEAVFSKQELPENNWKIRYHLVKDTKGQIVLASPYTVALMMDDMLEDRTVSQKVKEQRKEDPYFLTSRTLMSGTPFTKGKSIYVDFAHDDWKEALKRHVQWLQQVAEEEKASKLIMREFSTPLRDRLKNYLLELGLVEIPLPNNMAVQDMQWETPEEFQVKLGQKYRYSLRKEILKHEANFNLRFERPVTGADKKQVYALYEQVYDRAADISVFRLPYGLFEKMFEDESYDFIRLYLNDRPEQPVAVMISQLIDGQYNALLVGLDYDFVKEKNVYKQILYQTIQRAKNLGCERVDLAYTAEMEKKKVGAQPEALYAFTMALEHFSHAQLDTLK